MFACFHAHDLSLDISIMHTNNLTPKKNVVLCLKKSRLMFLRHLVQKSIITVTVSM